MLISPNQIKAGRALIDWSAEELAKRCRVTKATISGIETGKSAGSVELLSRITYALQSAGVEFTEAGGVQPRQGKVMIYRGRDGFVSFFDDVYEVAKAHEKPDICVTNTNEALFDEWLDSYAPVHEKRMEDLGIRLRVIIEDGDQNLSSAKYCTYRWIPDDQFLDDTPFYIYGDKAAFIEFQTNDVIVTLVDNAVIAKSLRRLFEVTWRNAALTSAK
jgi:transcriptional regulator with XRE-family HTH domain